MAINQSQMSLIYYEEKRRGNNSWLKWKYDNQLFCSILVIYYITYLVESQIAWIIPGNQNTKHSTILIRRSLPTPHFRKTATGGNNIAKIIKITLFIFKPYIYLNVTIHIIKFYVAYK